MHRLRTAEEKLRILELVAESSRPLKEILPELNVARSTFNLWKRCYVKGGIEGLRKQSSQSSWNHNEDELLEKLVQSDLSMSEISDSFPNRTRKAVEARLMKLGISFTNEKRAFRKKHGKACSVCKQRKPLSEFYTAKYESIDGKMSLCIECFSKAQKKFRDENRDRINTKAHEYRQQNLREDPDYFNKKSREFRRTSRGMFTSLRQRCKANEHRKAQFLLEWKSFDEWYQGQINECHYCGISLDDFLRVREHLPGRCPDIETLTIDRLNSTNHYEKGNIVLACYLCNYLKGYAFDEESFLDIAHKYIVPFLRKVGADV